MSQLLCLAAKEPDSGWRLLAQLGWQRRCLYWVPALCAPLVLPLDALSPCWLSTPCPGLSSHSPWHLTISHSTEKTTHEMDGETGSRLKAGMWAELRGSMCSSMCKAVRGPIPRTSRGLKKKKKPKEFRQYNFRIFVNFNFSQIITLADTSGGKFGR